MNLLAIETSTELASVTVSSGSTLLSEEQNQIKQHALCLLPMIDRLLAKGGLSFSQLEGVVFGRGPGSFTGLRIACSVAQAIGLAHDLPIYPVSTLAAIASTVYETMTSSMPHPGVLALIDARMNQVYWSYYASPHWTALEAVTNPEEVSTPSHPIVLAGVGFERYYDQLPKRVQDCIVQKQVIYPKAQYLLEIVQTGKINPVGAAEALPVYLRNQVVQGAPYG